MRVKILTMVVAALLASLAFAQVASFRSIKPVNVTASASDTTLTVSWDVVSVQVYPYDADLWVSYWPGAETPVKVPEATAYTIPAIIDSLTLHRAGDTAALVTFGHQ